jgi:uncharacterized membrane protein (DUF373 family)
MKKDKIISKTEDLVYLTLSILAILFIIIETVDLMYIFYKEVSRFSFASERPLGLSGVPIFFNIIITLEILETFKNHHNTTLSRVKIILLIAITAIVRKVITIDFKHVDYFLIIGIGIVILSICVGYYFLSKKENAEKHI